MNEKHLNLEVNPANQTITNFEYESPFITTSKPKKSCWYWLSTAISILFGTTIITICVFLTIDSTFRAKTVEFLVNFQDLTLKNMLMMIISESLYIAVGFSGTGVEILIAFSLKDVKQAVWMCLFGRTAGFFLTYILAYTCFRNLVTEWMNNISYYKDLKLICHHRPWIMSLLMKLAPLPRMLQHYGIPLLGLPLAKLYPATIVGSLPGMAWALTFGLSMRSLNDSTDTVNSENNLVRILFVSLGVYGMISCLLAAFAYKKFHKELHRMDNQRETQGFLPHE